MYTRRSHKKSRFGCKRCKARKTKCDEVHPTCGNCARHNTQCDFAPTTEDGAVRTLQPVKIVPIQKWLKSEDSTSRGVSPLSSVHSSATTALSVTPSVARTGSSSTVSSPYSIPGGNPLLSESRAQHSPIPSPIGTPENRLLELKLFHHYVEMTSSASLATPLLAEIPKRLPHQNMWAAWITGIAFSNPSLMDALLGFSAFHLLYHNPSDREMSCASHSYMLRALKGHAQDLRGGVDEKNAETVFATSTFVSFHAAMSQRLSTESQAKSPPIHWFRSYQGIKAILEVGWKWIQKSSIEPLLQERIKYLQNPITSQQQRLQLGVKELPFDFLLEGIFLEEHDTATLEAYEATVAHLNTVGLKNPIVSHVLLFPAAVCRRFVEMVEAQDPRTLAIVGYFFMLLKKAEKMWQVWWLRSTIDDEFKILMELLPSKWWPKMEWAVSVFQGHSDKVFGGFSVQHI